MRLDSLVQLVYDYLGHIGCGSGAIRGLEHDLVVVFHDIDAQALRLGPSDEIMTTSGVHQPFHPFADAR